MPIAHTFPFDIRKAGDALADADTCATVLHMIILAAYKEEIYGDADLDIEAIDPIELWLRIQEDFHTTIPEENENKINALMLALSTDIFYRDPLAFNSICNALYSGDLGDLIEGYVEDLTIPEMLWGIYEVELNRDDRVPFSPAVTKFIDEIISEEAEDKEELEEEEVIPYYERFVNEMRQDMFTQMRRLGVAEQVIRKITLEDLTPRHDENEEKTTQVATQ